MISRNLDKNTRLPKYVVLRAKLEMCSEAMLFLFFMWNILTNAKKSNVCFSPLFSFSFLNIQAPHSRQWQFIISYAFDAATQSMRSQTSSWTCRSPRGDAVRIYSQDLFTMCSKPGLEAHPLSALHPRCWRRGIVYYSHLCCAQQSKTYYYEPACHTAGSAGV